MTAPGPPGRGAARRGIRYLAVTAGNVAFGQAVLLAAQVAFDGTDRWLVNAATVVACAPVAYWSNRALVFDTRGRSDLRREVLPYWGFVGAGLFGTTAAVWLVGQAWSAATGDRHPPLVTNLTNLSVIGALWVLRFAWMRRAFAGPEAAAS